jgi:hypothetical protein
MNPSSTTRLAVLVLAIELSGCAFFQSHWPFQTGQTGQNSQTGPTTLLPVAIPTPTAQAIPSTIFGGKKSKRKKRHQKTATNQPAANGETPTGASVPVQPATSVPGTANVTMEANDADSSQAQALLDDADARLGKINRSKLTAETSTAFQQASDLAHAAHKATDQGDYLAASSLARKASTLAEQVTARLSSR